MFLRRFVEAYDPPNLTAQAEKTQRKKRRLGKRTRGEGAEGLLWRFTGCQTLADAEIQ